MASWPVSPGGPPGVVVSVPSHDHGGSDVGRLVWIQFHSTGTTVVDPPPFQSRLPRGKLGFALESAGDFDGDGIRELVLGAPAFRPNRSRVGAVVFFPGGSGGEIQPRTLIPEVERAHFGTALAVAGDVNGDRFDDLVVGAPAASRTEEAEGAAFLYLGGPAGLTNHPSWVAYGGTAGMRLGERIQAAGDVNGDGLADVLVGAPRWAATSPGHGEVRLYLGDREGLQPEPAWVYRGAWPYAQAGRGLAGGFDVNGDGRDDVLVGLPGWLLPKSSEHRSELQCFLGRPDGLPRTPDWTWESPLPSEGFGHSICLVGDMNGDGRPELAVAAPFARAVGKEHGRLRLFPGEPRGFGVRPMLEIWGGLPGSRYGFTLAALGDLDGDGLAELGVGSPDFPAGDRLNGRCDILFGSRGLGLRVFSLEALREPAFRTVGTNLYLAGAILKHPARPGRPWAATAGLALLAAASLGLWGWQRSRESGMARGAREDGALRERLRVAQDLHDHLGSGVTRIALLAERARRVASTHPQEADRRLGEIAAAASETARALEESLWILDARNDSLEACVGYLAEWARRFFEGGPVSLQLDLPAELPEIELTGEFRRALVLIVREALNNVAKHAGAGNVTLRIHPDFASGRAWLTIGIVDDGRGFTPGAHPAPPGGPPRRGLPGLRERVARLGGELTLETAPQAGTRLGVRLPLAGRPTAGPQSGSPANP
jgi:signal transduction histidine kinase